MTGLGPIRPVLHQLLFIWRGPGGRGIFAIFITNMKKITLGLTPHLWEDVEQVVIDKRDDIITTFAELEDLDYQSFEQCRCGDQGTVRILQKLLQNLLENEKQDYYVYFCNFHFRKACYRWLSNGKDMLEDQIINDGRKFFNVIPSIQASNLKLDQI